MAFFSQIKKLKRFAENYFSKGHERSIEAKKNIIGSMLVKGVSIAVGLISIPLTIHYINPSSYGIWITLSSMIAWISFFDIGFTHGLRNKFAEANAKGETEEARAYVSTAYYCISIIFFIIWLFLMAISQWLNWVKILNLPAGMNQELVRLATIIVTYFCSQFIFRLINTILIADQKPAKAAMLEMLGQAVSLIFIFFLTRFTKGSLVYLGLAAGIAPSLILLIANFYLFNTDYKKFKPSIKYVKISYAKSIMKIGVKFFILQIAVMVQFESSLFLIAHYFTDKTLITSYSIAYKYFSTMHMFFLILLSPFWTGVTYAYSSGDTEWIRNAVKKYLRFFVFIFITGIIMLILSDRIYKVWLHGAVSVEFGISFFCFVYFSTLIFSSIFINVLNGIGAIHVQFVSAIFSSIGFILLSLVLLNKTNLGVKSVLISSIACNIFGYIIAPVQYYQIFYKKAHAKIWYR